MYQIKDFYPLSPMQEGMLFHTLYAANSGVYVTQFSCAISGELNIGAFERAWQQVVNQHSILRSRFVWQDLKKPIQMVQPAVNLSLARHDWRGLSVSQRQERMEAHLQEDRVRGFDLSKAPLMRVALMRLGSEDYQFVWSFHHLLLDGWSISLLFRDLFACYEAICNGQALRLEPSRPFRDYIVWLQKQDLSQAETFWRQTLEGFQASTPLPLGRPAGGLEEGAKTYDKRQVQLSQELTTSLRSFARRHQLTVNTLVQGAWSVLLSRHSGEEDVVFGTVVSGRPTDLSGAETMVGLFINTIPVRVKVSAEGSLPAWLMKLQDQQLDARQYEYSPLQQVQAWSDVPRGQPLFESAVVFENYPVDTSIREQREKPGSLKISQARSVEQANYPMGLIVNPGPRLSLNILYDCTRFDADTVSRLLSDYEMILESLAADASQSPSEIKLLNTRRRERLLVEWNQTHGDYPKDICIHELFEQQVERNPKAVALVMQGEEVSYRELDQRANQLARYLQEQGVGPEQRVGVLMERGIEMIVAVLAVLKAGGGYVPLDGKYPQERLDYMLEDAGITMLVTERVLANRVGNQQGKVVSVDEQSQEIARRSTDRVQSGVGAGNLAYVIYTSGSTGKPKGVLVEHRGLCNLSEAQIREFNLTPDDRILQCASLSFDASIFEIVMALRIGATLHLAQQESMLGSALSDLLYEQGITNITIPPSLLAVLPATHLPALHTIIVAGEACPADLAERWSAGRRFFNAYGPTEATVWATVSQCRDGSRKPSIGRPISNAQVYLLDHRLEPVPVGAPGELHIGGIGLARGYHNRPDVTAEKFIPNPFSGAPGSRLYKTGDLARYLPDGEIDYIGRIDYQVKIRGFRIELEEVEAVLSQHPAVRAAVATAGEEGLVSYLAISPDSTLSVNELRKFLETKLPHYMVPSVFVILDELPLTPNGKVDRLALQARKVARTESEEDYIEPRSEVERTIAGIWEEVLHIEKVGIHEHFFDLGGHSLLMIQIHNKLQRSLEREISIIKLFQYPTVSSMAEHLTEYQIQQPLPGEIHDRVRKQKEVLAHYKRRDEERKRAV